MEELNKGLDFCIDGLRAETYLELFRAQICDWDVVMPEVRPLVSDFGLGRFEETGLIEYWIANEVADGYCGKYLFVFDGQACPMHRHKIKAETFFVVCGKVRMEYDGASLEMKRADVLRVERWRYHSFTGIGPALLLEVSTPCLIDDNYFENTNIPIGGNYQRQNDAAAKI